MLGGVRHRNPPFCSVVSDFLDRGGNRMFVGALHKHLERNINSFRRERADAHGLADWCVSLERRVA